MDVETSSRGARCQSEKVREHIAVKPASTSSNTFFPKSPATRGQHRLVDQPPVLFHVVEADWQERVQAGLSEYRQSLSDERRVLLDRYRLEDSALKVVGIGSVGTRCHIALFVSEENHPLVLQFKEARRSVLEPYTERSQYDNQGQRVVMGQRLMQSSQRHLFGLGAGAARL
jgi:uncharacterized protein (DUF2252 family)